MDKAEYRIATEHIKKLIAKGEYAEASHIADTIDWSRVKSVMMLCTVSDLYKINRRYEDAKEILYMAYERNPESRTILYSLCDLSIKLEEFVAAIEYYKSFVEVAPRDTGRYVLQYRLYQAQDVGLEERIDVLEQLKSEEYTEKWAYELAYLYHRIGFATKCVEECDELILWFGTGRYVYKAMELKMLHEPLTPSQQRTYDHRFEHLEQAKDMTRVLPRIDSGDSEMTDESMVDVTDAPTVEIPKEYIEKELHTEPEEIQVKTLDVANAYNTMNLQKELADSLREILEGTQAESNAEEPNVEELKVDEPTIVASDVVDAVNKVIQEPVAEVVLELEEDEPAQEVPEVIIEDVTAIVEEAMVNDQITGQLSIDDIFAAIEAEKKKDLFTVAEETSVETEEEASLDEIEAALEAASDAYAEEFAAQQAADAYAEEIVTQQVVDEVLEEAEEEYAEPEEAVEEAVDETVPVEAPVREEVPKETSQERSVDVTTGKDFSKYEDFIRSKETEEQIAAAKKHISMDSVCGNVAVTGHDLSICFDFIKVFMTDLKKQGFDIKGKTAKISAVNLNKKEPSEIIKKVQAGILIIERAGRLRKETVAKIEACLKEEISSVLVFVTDTEQGMNRFAERYPSLAKLIDLRVDIKDYSGEELVTYAVKYAYDQEYSIDEMGLLALRTRIDEMIADDDAPTMNDAQHVIDEAMEHANQKNFKHFMDVLLRKRYDEEDMIILREEDFL
ncbi:MAG: hypothetical protein IKK03_05370 [Lachnospiraceae bacterium]|nr:hypothetical protein [Lachnospiraceae bacterium]